MIDDENTVRHLALRLVFMRSSRLVLINIPALILQGIFWCSQTHSAAHQGYDFSELAEALSHVDSEGMVDYRALKENRKSLDLFSKRIAELDPEVLSRWSTNEKIAFWINAYNGLTLLAIIDHYPIKPSFLGSLIYPKNSVRQIVGLWDELNFTVLGETRTLDYIEHRILRTEFDEPRIHMALVCGAKGCPALRREPYLGSRLDEQLDDQARAFVSDPTKFRIDRVQNVVSISEIFDWFGEDFESRYGTDDTSRGRERSLRAVLNFISIYLLQADAAYLESAEFAVRHFEYDWSLNEHGTSS